MKRIALCLGLIVLVLSAPAVWADETEFSFQTAIYPGDTFTQLLSINLSNKIAGYHGATINKGFLLTLPSSFLNFNFPHSVQTQVTGINNINNTSGFYIDTHGVTNGFLSQRTTFTKVDFPNTPFNQLLGRNNFNQAAGYYSVAANGMGNDHPYTYDIGGGVFREIFIPGAVSAQATGINDHQDISGFYIDAHQKMHGFLLVPGSFKTLDFPGATSTMANGLNNNGLVVGVYTDTSNLMHGFVYNPNGSSPEEVFDSIDDPNGVGTTTINGVNDHGWVVGFYVDSQGHTDGFVGTPVP